MLVETRPVVVYVNTLPADHAEIVSVPRRDVTWAGLTAEVIQGSRACIIGPFSQLFQIPYIQ
jgi:hypothetical protein